jgi:WD40 repeat protein
MLDM